MLDYFVILTLYISDIIHFILGIINLSSIFSSDLMHLQNKKMVKHDLLLNARLKE